MTVSIFDLPKDDTEVLPAGKWVCALKDRISDSFGIMTFVEGVTTEPIDGRALIKACTFFLVDGAMRVEGEKCELGDVTRLAAFGATLPPPTKPPTVEPVNTQAAVAPAAAQQPAKLAAEADPKTKRDLEALDEDALRKLGAQYGLTDKRWSAQKLVRELAEELNLGD